MKIYDITQELFSGKVYPGDIGPSFNRQMKIMGGDPCNLTVLTMGTHNATHVDAPFHFYDEGKTIDQIELSKCIGICTVTGFLCQPGIGEIEALLKTCEKRLLFKGDIVITIEIARLLNQYHIELIGVESQSVGPVGAPMEVHRELLREEVVLLEGIQLGQVPEGRYFLNAAPLKLGGSDGAPCRAVLIDNIE